MSSYIKPIITNNLLTLDGSSNQLFTSLTLEIFDSNANSVFTSNSNSNSNSADWTLGTDAFFTPTWSLDVSALSLADGNYNVVLTTINNPSFPFNSDVHNPPGFELIIDTVAPVVSIDTSVGVVADGYINRNESNNPLVFTGTATGVDDGQRVTVTLTDINNNSVSAIGSVVGGTWTAGNFYTETTVNTTTVFDRGNPQITSLTDGGYVVSWLSYGYGVLAQRYDAAGDKVGGEISVSSPSDPLLAPNIWALSITGLTDGGYVVTWQSDIDDGNGTDIYAQRYDAANNTIGSETLINSTTADNQYAPSVTGLVDGGYIVSWNTDQFSSTSDIYAQRFDAAGNTVGSETLINSTTADNQYNSNITGLADGGYIVSWTSGNQDGDIIGIYAQRYDAAGNTVGNETHINTTTADNQYDSSITGLTDGGYVVSWISDNQDGDGTGIYAQRFDASGNTVGSETLINTTTTGNQMAPSITALNDGGYIVSWHLADELNNGTAIYAQRYDASNNAVGGETLINTSTNSTQTTPNIAGLDDGGYVVSWHTKNINQYGTTSDIHTQRFAANGSRESPTGIDFSNLDDGPLTIDVSVTDIAGNTATAQNTSVVLDTIANPTVNAMDTANTWTWLSGTFDADNAASLTVTVDGQTYTLGVDSNLFQHANNDNVWVLKPTGFYHLGTHDIQVTVTNAAGGSDTDQTTGELTISRDMKTPRVDGARQIYNNRPAIGGYFDEAATEELTVEIDGTVYTLGVDTELTSNGPNNWALNLMTLETPLADGVYDVVVTTTDANSVSLQDSSVGELTIGMLAPTVAELETTNFKPVLSGFYDSDFANGLTVTVNGDSYTLGVDSELSIHANNDDLWKLQLSQRLDFGDNDIQVTATDTLGRDKTDTTVDEVHIYQSKSQAVNGDVLVTQEGNDTITINDNTFTQIDAGLGTDTLLLDGDAINLNFTNIQGIDVVDLNDGESTANTLTLTLDDVLTTTDNNSLSVLGDNADTVTLTMADNWAVNGSQVIDSITYDAYDSGSASLLIEQGITVQVV